MTTDIMTTDIMTTDIMTTDITTTAPIDIAPAAAPGPPVDVAPAAAPAPPKPKPVTWETERNAAVAALARAGATPREARVLASLGANAAAELRSLAKEGVGDVTTVDDRAAQTVLEAHRAAANPEWRQ